jgi:hypothetical protein
MKKPKKQEKYKVLTARRLRAMLKMAEAQNGIIIARMESAGRKYPGQLQFTEESYDAILEYCDD